MEKDLDNLETPRHQQQETFDGEKNKFMNNKISIWDYYGVPMNTYLSYGSEEKTKMFKEYYKSQKYYGNGKIGVIVSFLKMVSFFMFLMLFALFSASDHFCVVPFQLVSVHRP